MAVCARRGCGKDAGNTVEPCRYHPGAPVFHEGLKSWSCCKQVNKPVLEFDQFLALPGCTQESTHTTEKQALPVAAEPAKKADDSPLTAALSGNTLLAAQNATTKQVTQDVVPKKEAVEEQDPPDAQPAIGAACKRGGCTYTLQGERDRSTESCKYHKGSPIFHEGSKGWSCCKKRVLEFDLFLQIPPCTEAEHGHLFVGAPKASGVDGAELVDCRQDHYETPADVRLSVYAKAVDQGKSSVKFESDQVVFDLSMADGKRRYQKVLRTFAPISPSESSFTFTKFKVELILVKQDKGRSWPCLESSDKVIGYGLTFGRDKDK